MTESRHRTTLEIKADTRGVKELGKEMEKALSPSMVEAFEASMERVTSSITRLTKEIGNLSKEMEGKGPTGGAGMPGGVPGGGRGGVSGEGGRGGKGGGFWPTFAGAGAGSYLGTRAATAGGRMQQLMTAGAGGGGVAEGVANIIPIIGSAIAGNITAMRRTYQMGAARSQAVGGAFGATGLGAGGLGDYAKLGITQDAAAGMLGQVGPQARMRGKELKGAGYEMIRAKRMHGIDMSGLVGAGRITGEGVSGKEGVSRELKETMASAFSIALHRADMPKFTEQTAELLRDIEMQGLDVKSEDIRQVLTAFSTATGISGMAGMQTGKQLYDRVKQGAGGFFQGGLDFSTAMLLGMGAGGGKGDIITQLSNISSNKPTAGGARPMDMLARQIKAQPMMGLAMGLTPMQIEAMRTGKTPTVAEIEARKEEGLVGVGKEKGVYKGAVGIAASEAALVNEQLALLNTGLADTIAALKKRELSLMKYLTPYTKAALDKGMEGAKEVIKFWKAMKAIDVPTGGAPERSGTDEGVDILFGDPKERARREQKAYERRKNRYLRKSRGKPGGTLGTEEEQETQGGLGKIGSNEKSATFRLAGLSLLRLAELEDMEVIEAEGIEVGA